MLDRYIWAWKSLSEGNSWIEDNKVTDDRKKEIEEHLTRILSRRSKVGLTMVHDLLYEIESLTRLTVEQNDVLTELDNHLRITSEVYGVVDPLRREGESHHRAFRRLVRQARR